MIENSLTYQFLKNSPTGHDISPEAMILKLSNGKTIKYVPEGPKLVFKVGQIVRVHKTNDADWNQYGVIESIGIFKASVNFGRHSNYHFMNDLEMVHEVS